MAVLVIAEAGVNHNGNPALARKLIDLAADASADAVKFQTFRAERLAIESMEKALYQKETTDADQSQFEMLKGLELSDSEFIDLAKYCEAKDITFLSTPFDSDSMDFLLRETAMEMIKIPSGEVVNGPLLLHAARTGKQIIMSTGMCDMNEIRAALSILAFGFIGSDWSPCEKEFETAFASPEGQQKLKEKVTLLHCTSEYPTPFDDVNLGAIKTMRKAFGLPVGFSDHSKGTAIPVAAAALGAVVIEKHFTLDKNMDGPDHQASLSPDELHKMIAGIRSIEAALGSGEKVPTMSEYANRSVIRRSLVARIPIAKGDLFSPENIVAKRPGSGLSPMAIYDIFGCAAKRNYASDEMIDP